MVTPKEGASALGLQRVVDLRSYRTAWSLLQKLRRAMGRAGRERLRGIVEVDESHLGAPDPGQSGRQPGSKTLIVAAVACVGARQLGRLRLRQVRAASAAQ
ncbi:MAG: IS1595 family transposase, partial [Chthoniobacteraceae bacterium]